MKSDKPKGKPKPREYELVGADEIIAKDASLFRAGAGSRR